MARYDASEAGEPFLRARARAQPRKVLTDRRAAARDLIAAVATAAEAVGYKVVRDDEIEGEWNMESRGRNVFIGVEGGEADQIYVVRMKYRHNDFPPTTCAVEYDPVLKLFLGRPRMSQSHSALDRSVPAVTL